jgi:hypothetical protein
MRSTNDLIWLVGGPANGCHKRKLDKCTTMWTTKRTTKRGARTVTRNGNLKHFSCTHNLHILQYGDFEPSMTIAAMVDYRTLHSATVTKAIESVAPEAFCNSATEMMENLRLE